MSIRSFFVPNCTETAALCNKAEYREASLREKVKMKFHLFLCSNCNSYNKRNHKLTSLLDKANLKYCTEDEKTNLKKHIENQCASLAKQNKEK